MAFLKLTQTSQQHHNFILCSLVKRLLNCVWTQDVLRIVNSFSLQLVLDIGLHKYQLLHEFIHGLKSVNFKLDLVKELTVTIIVLYNAKGLFIIHLVLLNLLNFIFFILMQDIFFKTRPIFLKYLDVFHSIMEKGGYKLVKIGKMHTLRVHMFDHLFIEVHFKHGLILLSQSYNRHIERFQMEITIKLD